MMPPTPPGTSPSSLADRRRAAETLYATGHYLLDEDRPAHASGVFRAMALLAPTDERAWLGLGQCHEKLGHEAVALEMYGTGRVLAPQPVRTELARARLLAARGEDEQAQAAIERARSLAEASGDDVLVALVEAHAPSILLAPESS